jgi:hypothetical protein
MRVYVNHRPLDLPPGMTVKHALIQAGLSHGLESGLKVYDDWGNEVGLDGAICEGMRLHLR